MIFCCCCFISFSLLCDYNSFEISSLFSSLLSMCTSHIVYSNSYYYAYATAILLIMSNRCAQEHTRARTSAIAHEQSVKHPSLAAHRQCKIILISRRSSVIIHFSRIYDFMLLFYNLRHNRQRTSRARERERDKIIGNSLDASIVFLIVTHES